MTSRLSVLMTVYDEASFVDYAVRSCLPHVDDLVIVEGAYQESIKLGRPARSSDGTVDIVEKYRDNPKVHMVYANEKSDPQQRNVGLDVIKKINPDGWCLIIDGDEVYDPSTFNLVKSSAKNMERTGRYAAYFSSITFVNNFNFYCNQEFPRLFRLTPGCRFINDNFLEWPDKGLQWAFPHVVKLLNVKYYHFAFCKGTSRFNDKVKWWMNRGLGPNFNYSWHIDRDGKICDTGHKIYEYIGRLPDIMKGHPMYEGK